MAVAEDLHQEVRPGTCQWQQTATDGISELAVNTSRMPLVLEEVVGNKREEENKERSKLNRQNKHQKNIRYSKGLKERKINRPPEKEKRKTASFSTFRTPARSRS